MDLGILFLGVSAQIIGAFIARDEVMYAKSLWFGVLLALVSTYHMYRSLDRALDQPEKTATKMIIRAYILRYVMLIFFLLVMMKIGVMNPLIFFFTYVICMKVTVPRDGSDTPGDAGGDCGRQNCSADCGRSGSPEGWRSDRGTTE